MTTDPDQDDKIARERFYRDRAPPSSKRRCRRRAWRLVMSSAPAVWALANVAGDQRARFPAEVFPYDSRAALFDIAFGFVGYFASDRQRAVHYTAKEAAMARSRRFVVALPLALLLVSVPFVLCSPPNVAAQATHSGTFSVAAGSGHVIYETRTFLLQGGLALPGTDPENVLLTVCPTSGAVDVKVDGNLVWGELGFCVTRNETVKFSIGVTGHPDGAGTYSISVILLPPTKK